MEQGKIDVVVIGSGMGGMCAAALLAHAGYKTLVAEKLGRIGGRYSTEEYEGFKLPLGAIVLHNSGHTFPVLKQLGIKLEFRDCPRAFYRFEGKDYALPEKGRFSALLNILEKAEEGRAKLVGHIVKEVASQKVMGAFRRGVSSPEKEGRLTVRDWLMQYTDNEWVHQIFDNITVAYVMGRAWEVPASQLFLFMAKMGGMTDISLAAKGNIAVMDSLAEVVKRNGDVWTNCPAKRILIKKGAVSGVVVEKEGKEVEIPCTVVISNCGPRATVDMAGKEHFDEDYLRDMRVKLRPHPVTFILIASDKPLCLEGQRASYLITNARRITGGLPITNICPEWAPKGQHLLYICGEPISTLTPVEPEVEIMQCTRDVKEFFPDFEKHGRILKMDVRNIDSDFVEARTWNGYDLPRETPVRNLYNVGDAVKTLGLGGTSACSETAVRVVESVKKTVKR